MTYAIDKNLPMPKKIFLESESAKYPFASMEVGDSFFVPHKPDIDARKALTHMTSAQYSWRKTRGSNFKFRCRTVEGGLRCWRVA